MGSLIGIASGVRLGCRSVFSEVESVVSFQVQAASLLLFCPVFQGIFWTMPGDFVCSLGTVDGSVRPPCAFLYIWRFHVFHCTQRILRWIGTLTCGARTSGS